MNLYFAVLRDHGAEFGYRVAHDAARFAHYFEALGGGKFWQVKQEGPPAVEAAWVAKDAVGRVWFDAAFDAIVVQKFLPKLHGSRAKLGPLLRKLYALCIEPAAEQPRPLAEALKRATESAKSTAPKDEPTTDVPSTARYPVSAEKIARMWRLWRDNGFASFAEA